MFLAEKGILPGCHIVDGWVRHVAVSLHSMRSIYSRKCTDVELAFVARAHFDTMTSTLDGHNGGCDDSDGSGGGGVNGGSGGNGSLDEREKGGQKAFHCDKHL